MQKEPAAEPGENVHLIVVEDEEIKIEHYPEDWLCFFVFWALAGIVFLQFFTRYVLNDSVAWTEEIARYGLIWITFLGGVMVTRRNNHIAVVLAPNLLPAPAARFLLAVVDVLTFTFLALLSYFSVLIFERMQFQRMTIVDLPMSYVYGAVLVGCFLMCFRQLQRVVRNARDGWRSALDALTAGIVTDEKNGKAEGGKS
jgi:TRAP-type C4-dicarboxylate transport system permease small subunit